MNDEQAKRVSELLTEVADLHHRTYRIVDGSDDDWASWYADWLIRLSELPQVLGRALVRSHLTCRLVELDREYNSEPRSEPWQDFFARSLIAGRAP